MTMNKTKFLTIEIKEDAYDFLKRWQIAVTEDFMFNNLTKKQVRLFKNEDLFLEHVLDVALHTWLIEVGSKCPTNYITNINAELKTNSLSIVNKS